MRFPGFIGPSYTAQSPNVDCQRCVNLYPEMNDLGTGKEREVASLVPTPGLRLLLTLPNSPVRGQYTASNGTLFAVGGNKLYSISSAWVATELGSLSTSTGAVSFADNGTSVLLVDGQYGYTCTVAGASFAQVTDPDFYAADHVAFLDGYFILNKSGSQQFFTSGLNAITFDPLDISTAEGSPDNLVGLTVLNQQLYLFGDQSTEIFYDNGDPDFPFVRIQGAVMPYGCKAKHSIARVGGAIYWLGGNETGSGVIYQTQGSGAKRISTSAIEAVIRDLDQSTLSSARAWVYSQGGHDFYCLNLPGATSTWVYDASTGLWHERTYLNLWSMERHRADCAAVAYNRNVCGDYETGKIYQLDPDYYTDAGTSIKRLRAAPHLSEGLTNVRHNRFTLDMETGVGLDGSGQGTDPQVMLRYSDDGGHSWSAERWTSAGAIGATKTRVIWRRLGSSRDRVYEVSITDPVKAVLIGAELDMQGGAA